MSRTKGMNVTCERCGNTVFLKQIEDLVMDGGLTRNEQYEEMPEGWGTFYCEGKSMDMCPRCLEHMRNAVKEAMLVFAIERRRE